MIIRVQPGQTIQLGRVGENQTVHVQFDLSGWVKEYIAGTAILYCGIPNALFPIGAAQHITATDPIFYWDITSDILANGINQLCQFEFRPDSDPERVALSTPYQIQINDSVMSTIVYPSVSSALINFYNALNQTTANVTLVGPDQNAAVTVAPQIPLEFDFTLPYGGFTILDTYASIAARDAGWYDPKWSEGGMCLIVDAAGTPAEEGNIYIWVDDESVKWRYVFNVVDIEALQGVQGESVKAITIEQNGLMRANFYNPATQTYRNEAIMGDNIILSIANWATQANSSAISAAASASNASAAAQVSYNHSNNAHNYANNAQNFSNSSRNYANAAQNAANSANSSTVTISGYMTTISGYMNNAYNYANNAHNYANTSHNYANDAHNYANNSQNSANAASANAGFAYTNAQTALGAVTNATTQATYAQTNAGLARNYSNDAYNYANSAHDYSNYASSNASKATTQAGYATANAGIATTKASEASSYANDAQNFANSAANDATNVSADLITIRTYKNQASGYANDAHNYANNALNSVNSASSSASTATTQAGYASANAGHAATNAQSAATSASQAQANAALARANAQSAASSASTATQKASDAQNAANAANVALAAFIGASAKANTNTLASGTTSNVSVNYTSSNGVFDFTFNIPRGNTGEAATIAHTYYGTSNSVSIYPTTWTTVINDVTVVSGEYLWVKHEWNDNTIDYIPIRYGINGNGAGDMLHSVYDSTNAVAANGGITAYVNSYGGKIDQIYVNDELVPIVNKQISLAIPNVFYDSVGYVDV